jgi:hypothetical protein
MVDTGAAYTIDEFCARQKMCRATYYNLKKQKRGPRTFRIGNRERISPEAEADWRRDMEEDAARQMDDPPRDRITPGAEAAARREMEEDAAPRCAIESRDRGAMYKGKAGLKPKAQPSPRVRR